MVDITFNLGLNESKFIWVQRNPCKTCPHRKETPLDGSKVENMCKDENGKFNRVQYCHSSHGAYSGFEDAVICNMFYNKHKKDIPILKFAEEQELVEFADIDLLKDCNINYTQKELLKNETVKELLK